MPIINTYYTDDIHKERLLENATSLKAYFAEKLTCGELALNPNEITIRLISTPRQGMIADLEIEMFAHAFAERVKKQDQICLDARQHIQELLPELNDVRVWLVLSELGHSWES